MVFGDTDMGGSNRRGDGGTGPPQTISVFNIMPMGGAWKELTSNGPHSSSSPLPMIAPWRRPR